MLNRSRIRSRDRGAIALKVLLLMTVFFAMSALAVDIGFIVLTRTQLQAASDSAALSAGTELRYGFGTPAPKTQGEIDTLARALAVEYAGYHVNGLRTSTYADGTRDVRLGYARFDSNTSQWEADFDGIPEWAPPGYNAVEVTVHRDQAGSNLGDGPLGLLIAPLIGFNTDNVMARAKAALVPASGLSVTEEGGPTDILPFAFRDLEWERYLQAQIDYTAMYGEGNTGDVTALGNMIYRRFYDEDGNVLIDENPSGNTVTDPETNEVLGTQYIFDNYTWTTDADGNYVSIPGGDGILEADIYPEVVGGAGNTAGNAGTIDIGPGNNSSDDIRDQIIDGVTSADLEYFLETYNNVQELEWAEEDGTFEDPLVAEGETGISGGPIEQGMNAILGEPRAIMLFSQVVNPGNNAEYTLEAIVGVAIMAADLSGNDKHVLIQRAPVTLNSVTPDPTGEIGANTTVFAPLMLIE